MSMAPGAADGPLGSLAEVEADVVDHKDAMGGREEWTQAKRTRQCMQPRKPEDPSEEAADQIFRWNLLRVLRNLWPEQSPYGAS